VSATNGHAPDDRCAPLTTVSDGRGKRGRFTAGNRFGKGNPFTRKLGAMRTAFLHAVGPEDVQALARKLLELALGGDLAAASLFLLYSIGKPTEAVDPDDLDADEFTKAVRALPRGEPRAEGLAALDPALSAAVGARIHAAITRLLECDSMKR
jgi:hypothetical protein